MTLFGVESSVILLLFYRPAEVNPQVCTPHLPHPAMKENVDKSEDNAKQAENKRVNHSH